MINTCEIALPINLANDSLHHKVIASKLLSISVDSITSLKILKRSIAVSYTHLTLPTSDLV